MPRRKPDPEWDHVHFSNYRMMLLSPDKWRRYANTLLDAAQLVESQVRDVWRHNMAWLKDTQSMRPKPTEILAVHFMLVAFAVENLLKAVLVRNRYGELRAAFETSGKLPANLKSHNLVVLAQTVGFAVDLESEDLLRRLTRAAVWAGRYPVPTEFREGSSAEEFTNGEQWMVSYFSEDDPDRIARLIARLRAELQI